MATSTQTATPNLRETRKEQAQARRAKAPAKKAALKPASTAGGATSSEAPGQARTPAKKPAAATTPSPKLRWTFPNGKDEYGDGKTQVAAFGDGELVIERSGEKWQALYRVDGKTVEALAEGSFGKAYSAAVKRSREAA
jgi:hypothetical protein